MRMISRKGKIRTKKLPGAVARSGKKAQRAFAKAHDAAARKHGEGERAHRIAVDALKDRFEKVDKRWERKPKPSARTPATASRRRPATANVDASATKAQLYDIAKRLEIAGRSTMSKGDLLQAIQRTGTPAASRK